MYGRSFLYNKVVDAFLAENTINGDVYLDVFEIICTSSGGPATSVDFPKRWCSSSLEFERERWVDRGDPMT